MTKNKLLITLVVVAAVLAGGLLAVYNHSSQDNDRDAGRNPQENAQANNEEKVDIDPMNILILGLDDRDGDFRGRTDTIMLAGFNPEHEAINLLSIPRDTRVKIKGAYDKVNAAYVYGGPELTRKTLEDFLDIEIDYYVVIDFDAFVKMVDLVGGIEVDVPIRMKYEQENIDLYPGKQVLNGEQALGYARYRYTSEGDIGRAKRQQEVVKLLLEKMFKLRNVVKMPELIKTVYDHVETDFPLTQVTELAKAANQIKEKPINSMVLPGTNEKLLVDKEKNLRLWYYIPDRQKLAEISKLFQ